MDLKSLALESLNPCKAHEIMNLYTLWYPAAGSSAASIEGDDHDYESDISSRPSSSAKKKNFNQLNVHPWVSNSIKCTPLGKQLY